MRRLLGLGPWLLAACATARAPGGPPPRAVASMAVGPAASTTAEPAATTRAGGSAAAGEPAAPAAPAAADERWRRRAADAACQAGLRALVSGELARFSGIGRCGRIDAETALGSSGDEPSRFEQLGEYRVYHSGQGSVLVWFLADDLRVVQILYPKLKRPVVALLGQPEAKVRSRLSAAWDQWIYASRGLTLHVERATGAVITLFAYRPTTVDAFLETDIARVAKSEAPLEDLK